MNLSEIGLTPSQYSEAEDMDEDLIAAWLDALDNARGVRQPAAWFMAAIRTGRLPGEVPTTDRAKEVRLAEVWIRNAGMYEPSEAELVDALFGEHGSLKEWRDDFELQERMLDVYRKERPRGERSEVEFLDRHRRMREQRAADVARAKAEAARVEVLDEHDTHDRAAVAEAAS